MARSKREKQEELEKERVLEMTRSYEQELDEDNAVNDDNSSSPVGEVGAIPTEEDGDNKKNKKGAGNKSSQTKLTEEEIKKIQEEEEKQKKEKEKFNNKKADKVVKNIGKNKLESMNEVELAQYFLKLLYSPDSLVTGEPGFENKEAVLKSFYARFERLDKASQQYVENRFQYEVQRSSLSQQMVVTDSTIKNALHGIEASKHTLMGDTVGFVVEEKIGNYDSSSTHFTSLHTINALMSMNYKKGSYDYTDANGDIVRVEAVETSNIFNMLGEKTQTIKATHEAEDYIVNSLSVSNGENVASLLSIRANTKEIKEIIQKTIEEKVAIVKQHIKESALFGAGPIEGSGVTKEEQEKATERLENISKRNEEDRKNKNAENREAAKNKDPKEVYDRDKQIEAKFNRIPRALQELHLKKQKGFRLTKEEQKELNTNKKYLDYINFVNSSEKEIEKSIKLSSEKAIAGIKLDLSGLTKNYEDGKAYSYLDFINYYEKRSEGSLKEGDKIPCLEELCDIANADNAKSRGKRGTFARELKDNKEYAGYKKYIDAYSNVNKSLNKGEDELYNHAKGLKAAYFEILKDVKDADKADEIFQNVFVKNDKVYLNIVEANKVKTMSHEDIKLKSEEQDRVCEEEKKQLEEENSKNKEKEEEKNLKVKVNKPKEEKVSENTEGKVDFEAYITKAKDSFETSDLNLANNKANSLVAELNMEKTQDAQQGKQATQTKNNVNTLEDLGMSQANNNKK